MNQPEQNPYASPLATNAVESPDEDFRAVRNKTLRRWHSSLLILAIPAAANYILFDQVIRVEMQFAPLWLAAMRIADGVVFLGIMVFCWFLGLVLLEGIAKGIHYVCGRSVPGQRWLESMYRSLSHLVPVAFLGGLLWMIWLIGLYILGLDFFVISIPVGILAHILGAALYLRIFYHWFQLVRAPPTDDAAAEINR